MGGSAVYCGVCHKTLGYFDSECVCGFVKTTKDDISSDYLNEKLRYVDIKDGRKRKKDTMWRANKAILMNHDSYPEWGHETMIMGNMGECFVRIYRYNDDKTTLFLESLSVEEDFRRSNYATRLLYEVEYIAKEESRTHISLKAKEGSWMVDWYKRFGYVAIEEDGSYIWLTKKISK